MLTVSDSFKASESADVNEPKAKVQLVINQTKYLRSDISSLLSLDIYSSDWPQTGAIDGDRTELNEGSASNAYNGIGKSVWRSELTPTYPPTGFHHVCTAPYLFNGSRIVNRIKIYHKSGHGLASYRLYDWSYSVGIGAYYKGVCVASTNSWPPATPGLVTFNSTGTIDTIDFPDTLMGGIYIEITEVANHGEEAYVVEMEAYRVIDITSRVKAVEVDRGRDYKLANPIATQVNLECDNSDRFFSFDYLPTPAEVSAGFVNVDLAPNIGLIVQYGFGTEYVNYFTGSIDRITINPGGRTASISGRDGLKQLLNQTLSCKLKSFSGTTTDISYLLQYVMNICNFSSYEITADLTGQYIDYFFTDQENAIDTIRKLVQASGDAAFWFDENGQAIFQNYQTNVQQRRLYTSQVDFAGCSTLTNIDVYGISNQVQKQWVLIEDWTTGLRSGTGWTHGNYGDGSYDVTSGDSGQVYHSSTAHDTWLQTPSTYVTGTWNVRVKISSGSWIKVFFVVQSGTLHGYGAGSTSYYVEMRADMLTMSLNSISGGYVSVLGSTSFSLDSNYHDLRITRDANGIMQVYFDGTLAISATDNSITSCAGFGVTSELNILGARGDPTDVYVGKIYYSNQIIDGSVAVSTSTTYIQSDTIDQNAGGFVLLSEQLFESYNVVPASSTLAFRTRTSADGSTWDSWLTATPSSLIPSTTKRYIQWDATITDTMNVLFGFVQAKIYDVTVNWLTGAGRAKYPTTISKYISDTSTLLGVSQDYTDEMAGDTAVYNDIQVQAQPMILIGNSDVLCTGTINSGSTSLTVSITGGLSVSQLISIAGVTGPKLITAISGTTVTLATTANASVVNADVIGLDVQWQGTVGTPPTPISVASPFPMTNGTTYTFLIVPSNPVDTAHMTISSPTCISLVVGSGSCTYGFTYPSPTQPVFKVVCTGTGTITNLQLTEAHFENDNTILLQEERDSASIGAYGLRSYNLSNEFIVNPDFADSIAKYYLRQFKDPKSYISRCVIRPMYSLQIGDRVNIVESNTNLHLDYIVIGIKQSYSLSQIQTDLTLLGVTV
jgi:hypothetical protein